MFVPPLNMGQFQPSPATMSQWIYQIWQFLQDNPIATEEQIREFIQSELTQSETLENAIEDYLTENPPPAPVQSVQGKTGAVQLAYNEIVPASNTVPVYKASSTPSTNTLAGQYNLGYRLFVNTTSQEISTISPTGALSLVGRGKFDGTSIDLDSVEGDATIAESIKELQTAVSGIVVSGTWTPAVARANVSSAVGQWTKAGNVCVLKGVITFAASTNQGNLYILDSSLPFQPATVGLGGVGRIAESELNVILSTTDGNNNIWIGYPQAITGEDVSNRRLVFTLICISA